MSSISAYEVETPLVDLIARVERGEIVTVTRRGRPVARIVPAIDRRKEAKQALKRIRDRRKHITPAPLAELMASRHAGHRR